MILELIIALLCGVTAGSITGLAPGIHINLVSAFLILALPKTQEFQIPLLALAVFIVSMSIAHTFLDFIPSIYLGAPEEESFLSILPGHQLLLDGLGHQAVVLTLYGSLIALPLVCFFTPIFIIALPAFYNLIKIIMPFILIFISFFIIFRDKKIFSALLIFILAGFLGFATFNLPVKEPLMPLLTGLFGLSSIIISIKSKTKIEKQKIQTLKEIKLTKEEFTKASLASCISAPLCSFLPGIGSGHAAVLGSEIFKTNNRSFLFLLGAINVIVMSLSFVTLYAINKTRTGSAAAVQEILKIITIQDILIILATIILTGILSFLIAINISKVFAKSLNRINYSKINLAIAILLIIINLIFTNWLGFLVLFTSTSLGIFCSLSESKKINMMGALIIPSVIYYLVL